MRLPLALAAVLLATTPAFADESHCVVADPTGTPLNVRTSPNGPIIGPIDNGRRVYVMDRATDRNGKAWVYIGDTEHGVGVGWVIRRFINCD